MTKTKILTRKELLKATSKVRCPDFCDALIIELKHKKQDLESSRSD